jgi:hypothetical protein
MPLTLKLTLVPDKPLAAFRADKMIAAAQVRRAAAFMPSGPKMALGTDYKTSNSYCFKRSKWFMNRLEMIIYSGSKNTLCVVEINVGQRAAGRGRTISVPQIGVEIFQLG